MAATPIPVREFVRDAEIEQAVAFAEAGSLEPVANLLRDVHTPEATP
mgnify:CR=1 FL=1